jgi:hypothetical protein
VLACCKCCNEPSISIECRKLYELAEKLLDSQGEICSIEVFIYLFIYFFPFVECRLVYEEDGRVKRYTSLQSEWDN